MQLNVEQTKNYLKNVLELEKNRYEINSIIENINSNKYTPINEDLPPKTESTSWSDIKESLIGSIVLAFIASVVISAIFKVDVFPLGIILPVLAVILCIMLLISDSRDKEKAYINKCKEIKDKNSKNITLVNNQNNIIDVSEEQLKSAYNNTDKALQKAYSMDIIYPKYRNFVAMASIYEYFDSGRCTTLPEAYNTYELELRMDRITDRLDRIIAQLEQIKNNQFYIYNAIKEMQSNIDNLTSSVQECAKTLNKVEANTAITAYTAKVIERNQFFMRNATNSVHTII